jgi:hypothetical protein
MATQSSSEEYLKEFLDQKDHADNKPKVEESNKEEIKDLGSVKDLDFIGIDISELPCRDFYPAGTTVKVRPAKVSEIQAYSMVDDTNMYDVYEKVNHLVSSCVFLISPTGDKMPYTHLKDGDRWYLLFVIRELTFQKGKDLYIEVDNVQIPIQRKNFEFYKMDDKLKKYYRKEEGKFIFTTQMGEVEMSPPTLGVQKSFTDYMVDQTKKRKVLNQSFLKIIPFTLPNRLSITQEGIEKKLKEFGEMDIEMFQFLNGAAEKMTFGIKGVKMIDNQSGQEVRSDEIFPKGFSGLFVQHDAFDTFLT